MGNQSKLIRHDSGSYHLADSWSVLGLYKDKLSIFDDVFGFTELHLGTHFLLLLGSRDKY